MTRAASICGVILAAGESSRMGSNKALLPWPPSPSMSSKGTGNFLGAAISMLQPYCDLVIVVAGHHASELTPTIYSTGAFLVTNPDPDQGQFSSLRVGLQDVLNRGRDSALVALVDRPPARSSTVATLRSTFLEANDSVRAVVPEFRGKHGHPYLAGRALIEAFLRADPNDTARAVEHRHREFIQYLQVEDERVCLNINTPADYDQLLQSMTGSAT